MYPAVPEGPPLPRRRMSALSVVTMVLTGLGSAVLAVLIFLSGGPVGGLVTLLLAAVSFPLLIWVCFWLDRYEPEPARYRLAALVWGGIGAVAIGGGLTLVLSALTGSPEELAVVVWAPVTEEFGKGLFLVLIVLVRRRQLHGILDGIVYAALVGIGFAFVEDILYYQAALAEGPEALGVVFFLRGVITPFAHPLFTSAIGVGVGMAVTTRSPAVRVMAPLGGYLVAVTLHALWNGSGFFGGDVFFAVYALVMLPLLVAVVALAVWARFQEGKLLAATLGEVARMGWIQPGEIRWVARMSDRMAARRFARRVGGRSAARLVDDYQVTLTEIGFLHNRVTRGTASSDAGSRMDGLLLHAAALRPWVHLPQPASPPLTPPASWNPIPPSG